jgi:hypothetical protein
MGRMIRILYGSNQVHQQRFLTEVSKALHPEWCRTEITYYVAGIQNAILLQKLGAHDVRLMTNEPSIAPPEFGIDCNQAFLLQAAIADFSEILYLHYDIRTEKQPDTKMWDILRSKGGMLDGVIQGVVCVYIATRSCPMVASRGCWNDWRVFLTPAIFYCRDKQLIDAWVDAHKWLASIGLGDVYEGASQAALRYSLFKRFGDFDLKELVDIYDINIAKAFLHGRAINRCIPKNERDIYFVHR